MPKGVTAAGVATKNKKRRSSGVANFCLALALVVGGMWIASAVFVRCARNSHHLAGGLLQLAAVDSTPTSASSGSSLLRLPGTPGAAVETPTSCPATRPTDTVAPVQSVKSQPLQAQPVIPAPAPLPPATLPVPGAAPLPPAEAPGPMPAPLPPASVSAPAVKAAPTPSPEPAPAPLQTVANAITADDPAALAAYESGITLQNERRLVEAREKLSDALLSGKLSDGKSADCRNRLNAIANEVVFSATCFEGDPSCFSYTIRHGDLLVSVVKSQHLLVPAEGVQLVNGMSDPRKIRLGQTIKLIRGPIDAVVTKHTFTLDLYQSGLFLRSYTVGLGRSDCTPVGKWMVAEGGRVRHATWNPPPSSGQTRVIRWNEPGYPLGKAGIWIALRGLDEDTQNRSGYGIHGTDEPESIGKFGSLGCIRMPDQDIDEVYAFLLDGYSKVEIRP